MITAAGIIVPALAVTVMLRRWIAVIPWRITALFLVLTLAFLHGAVFTSRLPVPVDEVARGFPWRGLFPEATEARNALTNDTVKLFLPWMQVIREELAHGRIPLWNRHSFSGYPLLANGEAAPLSPLFLATLFVPLPKQIVAMAGLKIFLSLLFGFLLLRREGASDGAAVFGAAVFAFCSFETVYLYYSTTAVTALLPAAVFALLESLRRPRPATVTLVAIVICALMANGHPESVLHVAICALAFMLLERATLRRWVAPLLGVGAGMLTSAPAWIPVLEQVLRSERLAALRHATVMTFPGSAAWSLIAPNHFGNPAHHDWAGPLNYSIFASSYAGLLPLAIAAIALVLPRTSIRDRLLIVFAALCFIVAMNWTPVGHFLNRVPPFGVTANDKLRFATVFIVGFVAARVVSRFAWVAAALVILDLFAYNAGFNALVDAKYFRPHLPIVDALRAHAPKEPYRIVGRDWVFLPNASAQYGLEDVRGSDPMELATYAAFFKTFSTQEPGTDVKRVQDCDRPEIDFLNVRFLLAEPDAQMSAKWRTVYRGADGSLFENTNAERRFTSATAVIDSIANDDPGRFRLHLRANGSSTVMSSQPAAPGWIVLLDGREVARPGGTFITFEVPSGEHNVEVIYRPRSFYWSLGVAVAGIALLIAAGRYCGTVFGTNTQSDFAAGLSLPLLSTAVTS
jgi:hypothetical protein